MTLPSIGSLASTQDINKQLSQIRSYLNQLKDELEAELMNVGYDNLSADLKKRLSTMSDDIQVQGDSIIENQEYNIAQNANIGSSITTINSNITTISNNVTNIGNNVTNIQNNVTNIGNTVTNISNKITNYDTYTQNVDSITTWINTAEKGRATIINGGSIITGTIKADAIETTAVQTWMSSGYMASFAQVNASSYQFSDGKKRILQLSPYAVKAVNGATVYVLGTTTQPE